MQEIRALLTNCCGQIRIIVDTHAHKKPNKKKKAHRGYAFVVFEREKDMRGNTTIDIHTRCMLTTAA